jgi:2-dehydro-3-deoxyphosphogluconate aldolase / (4S)-4-hydroxy-2-oxoglutarate aldolase
MTREQLRAIVTATRVTAIIRLDDLSLFEPLADALIQGGIRSLEFTLTNVKALQVVEQLRRSVPLFDKGEAIIGIGSIRTIEQARLAVNAGAQLLVSPVFVPGMIEYAAQNEIVCAPGAYTPTEIETCWQLGADVVKVFPANDLGPNYMKAILAPMPDLRLMPTGGIDIANLGGYLKAGCAAVGVGSSLVNPAMIQAQDWNGLRHLAEQYVLAARNAR